MVYNLQKNKCMGPTDGSLFDNSFKVKSGRNFVPNQSLPPQPPVAMEGNDMDEKVVRAEK